MGTGWWQGHTSEGDPVPSAQRGRRDTPGRSARARGVPNTPNTVHDVRRRGAETRTENAGRSSGPFPFVRARREQKEDASDPHAAETQPRLTPTTRPDPTTKPCASRCPPPLGTPTVCGDHGQMGRQDLPGLSPASPHHSATLPVQGGGFTIHPVPFFNQWGLGARAALPAPLCPGSQRQSLSLSLKTAVTVISSWNDLVTERRARLCAELRGDASLVLIS